MPVMSQATQMALNEIADERMRQVDRFGQEFDDKNEKQDWLHFIGYYVAVAGTARLAAAPQRPFRSAMVKIGALAVAAIEWCDRRGISA